MNTSVIGSGNLKMAKLVMMESLSKSIRCESVARQCVEKDEFKAVRIIRNRIELFFRKNTSLYEVLNGNIEFLSKRISHPPRKIKEAYLDYMAHKYYLDLLFGYNTKRALIWCDSLARKLLTQIKSLIEPRPDIIVTTHFGAYYGLVNVISRVLPISVVIAKEKPYNGYMQCRNGLLNSPNIKPVLNMKQIFLAIKNKQTVLILPDRTNFANELANIQVKFIGTQLKIQPGLNLILRQNLNALFIWLRFNESYDDFYLDSYSIRSGEYKRVQFFFKIFGKIFIKSPGQWERIKYIDRMIIN